MRIQTQSVHFDADAKLLDFVSKKVEKLKTFNSQILSADVFLRLEQNSAKIQEKIAEIKLSVPGAVLVAKSKSKVFEESLDKAADSLRRQLLKHKDKIVQA